MYSIIKTSRILVQTPVSRAHAHRLLNLFPSNVIIKCTADSASGESGTVFRGNGGEGTSGAYERENKTGNQTVRRMVWHIAEEKRDNRGEERKKRESATGRRIPTGTTEDVNQWVIRAAVPEEGESRPLHSLHNSKGG